MRRERVPRWFIELVVCSLIFAWLPIVYQILAGVAASAAAELIHVLWVRRSLKYQLSNVAVVRITRVAGLEPRRDYHVR
jgi:hypothetical protein